MTTKEEWKVDYIEIRFQKGYDFQEAEKKLDRYEGRITFSNGEKETFTMNINSVSAEKYLGLMAESICQSANELAQKINNTIGPQKKQ